jgi:hypothetical protein
MKTLNDKMAELNERRRQKIEARAAELAAEEMSLRDLRQNHRLTQARLGKALKIGQGRCFQARAAQRPAHLDVAELCGSDGRRPAVDRRVFRIGQRLR